MSTYYNQKSVFSSFDELKSWEKVVISDENLPLCVEFYNESLGWAGFDREIYYTINGGDTWLKSEINMLADEGFGELYFLNESVGWALPSGVWGGDARDYLFISVNGGVNWSKNYLPESDALYSIDFVNEEIGFLVGQNYEDGGIIYRSFNQGENWERFNTDSIYLYDIDQVDSETGFACGYSFGRINPQYYRLGGIILSLS